MGHSRHPVRALGRVAALTATLTLGGCGGIDGIDLNGKVFDWMGVSSASETARKREPQLADRAPLVMPPDANKLPEPGSGLAAAPVNDASWPDDPNDRRKRAAKEREKLHMAYCRGEIQWKERALNRDASQPQSPYGPCPGLISGAMTNINKD
jgi:hypothetical protein